MEIIKDEEKLEVALKSLEVGVTYLIDNVTKVKSYVGPDETIVSLDINLSEEEIVNLQAELKEGIINDPNRDKLDISVGSQIKHAASKIYRKNLDSIATSNVGPDYHSGFIYGVANCAIGEAQRLYDKVIKEYLSYDAEQISEGGVLA